REVERLRRLARACRHAHVVTFVGPVAWPNERVTSPRGAPRQHPSSRTGLAQLLAAADIVAALPQRDAALPGLPWAMAAGRPIIPSATPAVAELLAQGRNAWLCGGSEPRDIAKRLIQAMEDPEQSQRVANTARMDAYRLFSRQRMLEQYAAVWQKL